MSKNSVYVVGAGASKEANLPTGSELKEQIAQLLDFRHSDILGRKLESGDPVIWEAIRIHIGSGDINPYLSAARHIRDAMPLAISIDNFIDDHHDDKKIALCGKLAIIRSILIAEKESLLYFEKLRVDSNINFGSLKNTWYKPFFELFTENCGKDDLKERFKSVTLIIFNYDRCIEHFIYYGLKNYYRLSNEEAADLVKEIKIFHPYGDVGSLPWIDPNGAIDFGAELDAKNLLVLAKKIKTFTEGTDPDSSEILEIRKNMGAATRLVFLGFAFHELNMRLIAPDHVGFKRIPKINCFATTNNISESDKEVISGQIHDLYQSNRNDIFVKMSNLICDQFFKEFWRSLVF